MLAYSNILFIVVCTKTSKMQKQSTHYNQKWLLSLWFTAQFSMYIWGIIVMSTGSPSWMATVPLLKSIFFCDVLCMVKFASGAILSYFSSAVLCLKFVCLNITNRCDQGEGKHLKDSGPAKKHGILNGTDWLSSSLELTKLNWRISTQLGYTATTTGGS